MMNYLFRAFLVIFSIPMWLGQIAPQTKKLPLIPIYQDSIYSNPQKMGILENKKIDEASGLAFSRKHPNLIYTHNDSGGEPHVFLIDTLGNDKGKIILEGIKNRDWEDIAVGPGPDKNASYVYVGEIGDNQAKYSSIKIYRFPEPSKLSKDQSIKPEKLTLTYPGGARDAETLMIDPIENTIYIISKRDSSNTLYRAPIDAFKEKEYELEEVMQLPFTMAVGGDISADGSQIIVKNYLSVFYWERKTGESIAETLKNPPLKLPYKPEPQGEAIGFSPQGNSYFTLSEKRFNIQPTLYRYEKNR
ncbi:hypothetical protein ACFSKL_01720 [Belliella marina]|uniref:Integral membrane protein n=1 Tax=Belliella marina TaxID=1644146 RepID=A0ABW4VFL1_9BACT